MSQTTSAEPALPQCVVCGSAPLIKMHVAPRALFKDLVGEENHLIAGQEGTSGIRFSQNGWWSDSLICRGCEDRFSLADTYGVNFIRRVFAARPSRREQFVRVDNRKPDMLARFVLTCIWRSLAVRAHGIPTKFLGPYESQVRDIVFDHAQNSFGVLLSFSGITVGGKDAPMFVGPTFSRNSHLGASWWSIDLFGVRAMVKIGGAKSRLDLGDFDASRADPVNVMNMDKRPIEKVHSLRGVLGAMLEGRSPRPRS